MATQIPQRELRNNNADILNRVQAGEHFTVTRNGVPVADVSPHVVSSGAPMFPAASEVVAHRRTSGTLPLDAERWLADIRADGLDDDPFDGRV